MALTNLDWFIATPKILALTIWTYFFYPEATDFFYTPFEFLILCLCATWPVWLLMGAIYAMSRPKETSSRHPPKKTQ